MAFVRWVTAASTAAGSRLYVSGSISAKTGVAPARGDRLGGGDEGKRGRDHLIARTDTQGAQHQLDRRRAGADSNGMPRLAVGRKRLLECTHLRPQDEAGIVDHTSNGRVDLRLQGLVLRFQVDQWDGGRHDGQCTLGRVNGKIGGG